MARGTLRIYLGAAPGVGKTYRMLEEGRRRAERGTDVVIAVVETHGRARTAEQIGGLEIVPRRTISYRGSDFHEMDVDAVVARRPQVALVDEFAHSNVPGMRHEKRWQDVEYLLDHGIDVISTLNVQHLESLNDVVLQITGAPQRETVPDEVVRRAEQVELVDMAAQALRRRLAHGNVYPPERIDAALANFFREGNLLSLREVALLWTAGRVDEALRRYRAQHAITHTWETHERVVVGVDGRAGGEALLRRAARIAERSGGELLAVHVSRGDGLAGAADAAEVARLQRMTMELGGAWQVVSADDPARALVEVARSVEATQLVIGTRRRGRLARLRRGAAIAERLVPAATGIDVHLVSQGAPSKGGGVRWPGATGAPSRLLLGLLVGGGGLVGLTLLLDQVIGELAIQATYLLYLAVVLAAGAVGGIVAAVMSALAAALVVNWFFTEPVGTLTISRPENALALALFVLFGVAFGGAVDRGARRRTDAERSAAEATLLTQLTSQMLRGAKPAALLDQMRTTFGLERVELQERDASSPDGWRQLSTVGEGMRSSDSVGGRSEVAVLQVDEQRRVCAYGQSITASDRRVMAAFAAQVAIALTARDLAARVEESRALGQADAARRALLASVGHDLRTPLAGIKAAVSSLRQRDVQFTPEDQQELLATIEESTDRLTGLVRDLLDMSRLQADALTVARRAVWLDEVLGPVLREQPAGAVAVVAQEELPAVDADPVLLERVLSNLVSNAVRHGGGAPVTVRAEQFGERVEVRVIDRGPGVPPAAREQIFAPFQRLDADRDPTGGVGLGLAVARGFAQAMGVGLDLEDTPGGGLTMVVVLPPARADHPAQDAAEELA